jgi:hypothetical protein
MDTGIFFYHTADQTTKTVLVVPTSRRLHVVFITSHRGLIERTLPLDEQKFMKPAMPLAKGLPKFGGVARRKGSTKAARKWMAKAREAIA